jgi:hypothetical protein
MTEVCLYCVSVKFITLYLLHLDYMSDVLAQQSSVLTPLVFAELNLENSLLFSYHFEKRFFQTTVLLSSENLRTKRWVSKLGTFTKVQLKFILMAS